MLNLKEVLETRYMKEMAMFTEMEWELKRGNLDYYVAEEIFQPSLVVTTNKWNDLFSVNIELEHSEENVSLYVVTPIALDPITWGGIELPVLRTANVHEAREYVHDVYFKLVKYVKEALDKLDISHEEITKICEALVEIEQYFVLKFKSKL